jgi:hypothetical protein
MRKKKEAQEDKEAQAEEAAKENAPPKQVIFMTTFKE